MSAISLLPLHISSIILSASTSHLDLLSGFY